VSDNWWNSYSWDPTPKLPPEKFVTETELESEEKSGTTQGSDTVSDEAGA
jgi:hypothetical protein